MYRILLILYIIWGGVSIASGQDFNYSFTQLSTNQGLSQASVTSVTMDQKGRLWIGTQSGLNYYFQQQLKTFIHHESDSLSLPNNYINHIVEDSLGTIWVATSKEMVLYNSDNHNFTPTGYNCIYSSLCIEGGILFGSENIIFRYNYKSRTMDSIYICQKKNLDISEYRIQKMVQLKKNKILIGTKEQGIYLYDCCTQQLTRFTSDIHHLLISLYVVSDKYVYASFYGNGIYCYNQDGKIVKSYTSKTSSLNNNYVLDIIEHKGQLWIATDGGGINSLDPDTEEFRHDRSTWGDKVVSIAGFTRETLLLSVFSKGLFVYNKANGEQQLLTIDHPRLKQYLYYSGMAVNVYQDEPGSVLLLARHIYRYDTGSQKIRVVNEEEGMEIAGSMNAIAHNERFTYLNDSRTLYELDRTNNCLKRLFSCTGDTLLYSVSMDEKGDFWIGSNTGLGQYTPSTIRYHPLPTSLFGEVSSVICDHRGKVWIGADHMLFAWMLQSRKFILFGESDGVIPNEYLAKPRLVSGKGEVYMGGANGLLCIDNRFSTAPSDFPEVELTDVYINGEPAIKQITGQPEKLTLPQDSRTITLRIMSHEQDIFRKKRYRYQIEGLNDEPIESYDPELIIRSLPAGKYRILAACSTKNGDWTPFRPILSLTILPPWYRSGWFIICVLLIASGVIAAVILTILRRRQNRLKWELKERELQEYEEKIRFLVNVSNELLPSFTETGERELQIVELIRNRLRNGEKSKTDTDIKNIPKEEKSELSQPDETFLRKLNRLITDHLDSPELDVTFLCTEMGLSRASLYNKLKAMTNMGANDYINKFRMEKAIQLISTTDLTFTEIAEKIGFTTSRYFSTSFKQYTGETPTQYKEKIRKKQ